jgi:signal recognition particle GTPase
MRRYMLKVREIKVFTTHPSGIISYGISGYGKTTQTIRNAVLFYDRGSKVVVMSDHGRVELYFFLQPNDF